MNFILKENPSEEEITELRLNLRTYNDQFTEPYERMSLMYQIRDKTGELLGGVYGSISWEWLYIDLLWVDKLLRGTGAGTELINRIEEQARQKGVHRFRLSTTSFQALDFYKKMGYKVCGEIEDLPPGHTNFFLIKTDR
ncbi:MAG: GNAT family N-acetyltransferase [Balneolaceae bacterium]